MKSETTLAKLRHEALIGFMTIAIVGIGFGLGSFIASWF
jgi:hypothetical protein